MKLFAPLYDRAIGWSKHRHAPRYLAVLSFAESSFFPVPPDVMLLPMSLAQPKRAWWLATITTVASVLGGVVGYLLGMFAFELIEPLLVKFHYQDAFDKASQWFADYGFWVVLVAGFSPIPYKVFTVAAGVAGMPLLPFVLGSIIGRGGRFFLEAGLVRLGGEEAANKIRQHIEWLGWAMVILTCFGALYLLLR